MSTEEAVVVASRGKSFEVRAADGAHLLCDVRRKVKSAIDNTTPVAVGDDVRISRTGPDNGIIEEVKERRTAFFRPTVGLQQIKQVIAANLDQLAIVVSVSSPPLKTGLIDRFLIAAYLGQMRPLLIVNKIDLERPVDLECIRAAYEKMEVPTFTTSTMTNEGLTPLMEQLRGHRTLFAGHSGVGKSSVLNQLVPELALKTGEVSEYSNRGKHTTTTVEMYELPSGGYVVDSPGLKVMGLWDVEKQDVPHYYPDFVPFAAECRFSGCSHIHEPDCRVKAAVEKGEIAQFRYDNYLTIVDSLAF